MYSSTASAGFNQLPAQLPEWDNMWLGVSSGKEISNVGANQVVAPATWIKVYSKHRTLKNLTINYGNGLTSDFDQKCGGTKKLTAWRVNYKNEARSNTFKSLGNQSPGCGEKTITIPASAFSTQKSKVSGHEDAYVALLEIRITNDSVVNGPASYFRIYPNDASSVRLGFWGLYNSGEGSLLTETTPFSDLKQRGDRAVAFQVQGSADTIRYKFAPPCDYGGAQTLRFLNWSDDDRWGNANPWYTAPGIKSANLSISGTKYNIPVWMHSRGSGVDGQGVVSGGNPAPFSKFRWAGEGGQGFSSFTLQDNKKYLAEFENMAGAGGRNTMVVWFPFDSGDFDFDCPPDTGWRNSVSSRTNYNKVSFTQETEPTDPKPNTSLVPYEIGMDCSSYSSDTNRSRCNTWNSYYQTNRDKAVDALQNVRFTHNIGNRNPGSGYRHVATPANPGQCDGASVATYCARIQYRVYNKSLSAGSQWSDWRWRFSNSSTTSSAAETAEGVNHNGYTNNLAKNQTSRVWRSGWNTNERPQGMPPATKDMTSESNTANQLHGLLKDPEQGDQYCERVVTRKKSSFAGSDDRIESIPKCVTLSPGTEEDPYWNVKPLATVKDIVQQGENVRPNASVLLPVKDTDYDEDEDIDEQGPDGSGPSGEDYTAVSGGIYSVVRFRLPANKSINDIEGDLQSVTTNNQEACAWVISQTPGIDSGCGYTSGPFGLTSPIQPKAEPTSLPQSGAIPNDATGSMAIGESLCYVTTFSRPQAGHEGDDSSEMTYRHSKAACATVAKSPKVQFQNGDVRAGRGFTGYDMDGNKSLEASACFPGNASQRAGIVTSGSSSQTDNKWGSWVEYGAFATGDIIGFGSAAAPVGIADGKFKRLTFANTNTNPYVSGGSFNFEGCLPNYFEWVAESSAEQKSTNGANNEIQINDMASRQYFTKGKNVSLMDNQFGTDKSIILHVKKDDAGNGGDITIDGNIRFFAGLPYGSLSAVPQIIIIADGDITIADGVQQVDAWLISKGKINTCTNDKPTANECNVQLRINGPVSATKLNLYRTRGSDLTSATGGAEPAELFNLHPAHFLKKYGPQDGTPNQNAPVLSEKDLPPRY